MSITIQCPGCGKRFALKEELAGRRIQCKCGQAMIVPTPEVAEPEDAGNGLGSMEPPDPLKSLLDDDALPSVSKLPPASAARKAPPSTPAAGPVAPRKPKVSIDRAVLAKIIIVPVVLIAVGLLVMHLLSGVSEKLKPGYTTPQEAMLSFQKAMGERDWQDQMATMDKESQERGVAWVASIAQSLTESMPEMTVVLKKHGVPESEDPDTKANALTGIVPGAPPITLTGTEPGASPAEPAKSETDPAAAGSETEDSAETAAYTPPDFSKMRQEADQKRMELIAGVRDKTGFYTDVLAAVAHYEQLHASTNPLVKQMGIKAKKEVLKAMATAKISKVAIDGDVARAELAFKVGDIPQRVKVMFKKVNDRWFVHIPGPEESTDDSFADYFTSVVMIQW
jgi:hypothetical protein